MNMMPSGLISSSVMSNWTVMSLPPPFTSHPLENITVYSGKSWSSQLYSKLKEAQEYSKGK